MKGGARTWPFTEAFIAHYDRWSALFSMRSLPPAAPTHPQSSWPSFMAHMKLIDGIEDRKG